MVLRYDLGVNLALRPPSDMFFYFSQRAPRFSQRSLRCVYLVNPPLIPLLLVLPFSGLLSLPSGLKTEVRCEREGAVNEERSDGVRCEGKRRVQ